MPGGVMLEIIAPFFRDLYETTGWNFVIFYERYEWDRFVDAIWVSFELILFSLFPPSENL